MIFIKMFSIILDTWKQHQKVIFKKYVYIMENRQFEIMPSIYVSWYENTYIIMLRGTNMLINTR